MLQRRYVHGPGVDEPLVWHEGAGTADRRYLISDQLGSIVAANGNATSINAYDEFGVPAAANSGRFQYTGQMWLNEAGVYHYKARAYHPGLGRFAQTDPILYGGSMNVYAYVGNDPVNFVDPWGLQSFPAPGGLEPTPNGEIPSGCSDGKTGYTCPVVRRCPANSICDPARIRRFFESLRSTGYLPRPPGPIIDRRPTPNPYAQEPEGPVMCPVAEVEGSFGVQAGLKVAGIGVHGDAGSVRARASTERSGFVSTQGVSFQALGFTGSYGRESTGPDLQVGREQAGGELFFGLDVGVAAIYGANVRVGLHTNEGGGECP